MLADIYRDVVYAVRTLIKSPSFTAVAIFALALGIGANTTVYSVVNALLNFPIPMEDPERVTFIFSENPELEVTQSSVSMDDFLDWREQARSFDILIGGAAASYNLVGAGEPVRIQALQVSPGFFPLTGKPLTIGRAFREEESERGNHRVAVISHSFWQQKFGGAEDALGRVASLDGEDYTIVGVAHEDFFFPRRTTVLWTPLVHEAGTASRDTRTVFVMALLSEGTTADEATAEMETIASRIADAFPETNRGWTARVETLRDNLVSGTALAMILLYGSITFVLLIACANVANLLIARATVREKEMALRTSLGAGRLRLVRQLLTESVVLAGAGGVLGLIIGAWGLTVLRNWIAPDPNVGFIADGIAMDATVLLHTLAISMVAGILFGVVPAFQTSKSDLQSTLKEGGRTAGGGRRRRFLRSALVVAEISMALTLLGTSGAFIRAFAHIYTADPGFQPKGLLTLQLALPETDYPDEAQIPAFYDEALAELEAIPGVTSAALTTTLPLSMFPGATGSRITIDGRVEEVDQEGPRAFDIVVSPSYFETFRVPIVSGRAIASRDIEGALPVAVIGRETARRYWSESDPIGQRFKLGSLSDDSPWMTIVGVAGDVQTHSHSIRNTKMKSANVFLPIAQHRRRAASVAIRASVEPTGLAAGARQAIWSIDPRLPVDNVMSMPAAIAQTDTQNTFFLRVLTGLSLVALLLAGVGIYGIIAFAVNQRSHEIGIRMALGAKPSGILMLVIRQGAVLTLIGIVLGVAGAVAFVRFFGAQLEGIQVANASRALTYVSVSLMLIFVANLASFLPARRAVNVDPLVVLRYE